MLEGEREGVHLPRSSPHWVPRSAQGAGLQLAGGEEGWPTRWSHPVLGRKCQGPSRR